MTPTPYYQLIETRLGRPLAEYVEELRNDERSWPYIARKIREQADVGVSDETIRLWFADSARTSAA